MVENVGNFRKVSKEGAHFELESAGHFGAWETLRSSEHRRESSCWL